MSLIVQKNDFLTEGTKNTEKRVNRVSESNNLCELRGLSASPW
ncbi:MAG TPA: hypothetical protein PLX69_17615 [Leptospiraceae bacterium]|nr:hypothetical protein [Leptospiraceae bacterium]HRG76381.1 hypothetical protein [Leptospiraceae bacterium]